MKQAHSQPIHDMTSTSLCVRFSTVEAQCERNGSRLLTLATLCRGIGPKLDADRNATGFVSLSLPV
jgi:hypothetical protein